MDTARKRISTYLLHLPLRMPSYPGDGGGQESRQQLGLKYTGIPFGTPDAGATGRKKTILRLANQIGIRRGF